MSGLVREERLAQAAHAEGLDGKAGVILGFSGALVALTSGHYGTVMWMGRSMGATAAVLALWAFVPRRLPVPEPEVARELLEMDERAATIRLMDAEIDMIRQGRVFVRRQSLRIKVALGLLVVALGLTAASGVVK